MQPTVSVLSHLRLDVSIIWVQACVTWRSSGVKLLFYSMPLPGSPIFQIENCSWNATKACTIDRDNDSDRKSWERKREGRRERINLIGGKSSQPLTLLSTICDEEGKSACSAVCSGQLNPLWEESLSVVLLLLLCFLFFGCFGNGFVNHGSVLTQSNIFEIGRYPSTNRCG